MFHVAPSWRNKPELVTEAVVDNSAEVVVFGAAAAHAVLEDDFVLLFRTTAVITTPVTKAINAKNNTFQTLNCFHMELEGSCGTLNSSESNTGVFQLPSPLNMVGSPLYIVGETGNGLVAVSALLKVLRVIEETGDTTPTYSAP